ncbi:MAG: DegV family protein [Defluviitaleaceae bacterium]|nr:DegV family protein [Defluviitaleaceae bacterium]MCL2273733.1 DegV family protein [Defluviitaleaceae bacterium]
MYTIISDGGCDFTKVDVVRHNVDIIPFYITFDGETHMKEGVDISKDEYFTRLKTDKTLNPKTAQPSPQDYIDMLTPHLQAGNDVLVLTISSKLSGSHNSATLAAGMMEEEFPSRNIVVLDSLSASIGQGLILREIIKMRDAGFSLEKTAKRAEAVRNTTQLYFTVDSLEFLKKGGRVGTTTAFVGGILGLRPILHIQDGQAVQLETVRGKKNAYRLIEEAMVNALRDDVNDIQFNIGHILSEEDAVNFQVNIETALSVQMESPVTSIGAAIGTHAGPGALAFAYCKKYTACEANEKTSFIEERKAA